MTILQPLHTAVLVSDLAQAEQFYGDILGLSKVERSLNYPGAWYQLGEYQVHLMVDEQVPNGLHNRQKWGRNRHVAFAVASVDEAADHLTARGYPVQRSASGRAALFTYDPDGNVVELSELT
ncbi:MAG: VOC family protein [Synechococcales cyanobacterium K44_A2020_017]|nr:VOC family protein [Synechococcales cyanobacterium K32_A2020_035]MBF2096257.1 VOC family protein [Synechococcales cyanobacterium K44_A2020_017]